VIDAARKALELDPELAEAHVLLGTMYQKQWRWPDAENEFKTALDLTPNDANAHVGFANFLLSQGQIDEALDWAKRGRELDPAAVSAPELAWILFFARRYEDAERELRATLAVKPDQTTALWYLGFVLIADGRAGEAIPVLEKDLVVSHGSPGVKGVLVRAYATAGRRKDALHLLDELKQERRKGYVPAAAFIQAYRTRQRPGIRVARQRVRRAVGHHAMAKSRTYIRSSSSRPSFHRTDAPHRTSG